MKIAQLIFSLLLVGNNAFAMEYNAVIATKDKEEKINGELPTLKELCALIVGYSYAPYLYKNILPAELQEFITQILPKVFKKHPVYHYMLENSEQKVINVAQEMMKQFAQDALQGKLSFEKIEKDHYFQQLSPQLQFLLYNIQIQYIVGNGAQKQAYENLLTYLNKMNAPLHNLPQTTTYDRIKLFDKVWAARTTDKKVELTKEDEIEFKKLPQEARIYLSSLVQRKQSAQEKPKKNKKLRCILQ